MQPLWIGALVVYSITMLTIGAWAFRRAGNDSVELAVAGRRLSSPLAVGTWIATFQSGVAVVGLSGYISLFGYSAIGFLAIPMVLAGLLFVAVAARLHASRLLTLPQLIEERYGSYSLRLLATVLVVLFAGVAAVIQLYAAGLVIHTVTGLPLLGSIAFIGIVLLLYTMLGGLVSVVRTDTVQAVAMFVGAIAVAAYLFYRVGPQLLVPPTENHQVFTGGNVSGWGSVVGWMFVWIPGVLAQAFYLQRFFACRDAKTARTMVGVGTLLTVIFYSLVVVIGLGAARLLPAASHGDAAYPTLLLEVIGGPLGVLAILLLIAAVQSTIDSLLHIMGTYTTQDVYAHFRPDADQRQLALASRTLTTVLGGAVILAAVVMAMRPLPLIQQLQALSQGATGAVLFLPVFAGLFWRRATRAGAVAGMLGGLVVVVATYVLQFNEAISLTQPSLPGLAAGFVLFVGVSLLTKEDELSQRPVEAPMPEAPTP